MKFYTWRSACTPVYGRIHVSGRSPVWYQTCHGLCPELCLAHNRHSISMVQWMHEVCCAGGWDLQESTCMKRGLPLLCCDCLRICFCRYIWGFTMGNRIWCLTQILVSSPIEVIAFWKEEVTIGEVTFPMLLWTQQFSFGSQVTKCVTHWMSMSELQKGYFPYFLRPSMVLTQKGLQETLNYFGPSRICHRKLHVSLLIELHGNLTWHYIVFSVSSPYKIFM